MLKAPQDTQTLVLSAPFGANHTCLFNSEYGHSIKKNETIAATWMDLEYIILSEVSQTEKDKYHMISLICGI